MTLAHEDDRTVVVLEKNVAAEGVVSVVLGDPDGAALPSWTPGSHIDVHLGDDLVRQYSLCGEPGDATWRIGVLNEPASRGGSRYVHDSLNVGDRVLVRGPRNHFPFDAARSYLFIAGGIGVTPLIPMSRAAADAGADVQFWYGGRTEASMAFVGEQGGRVTLWPQDSKGLLPLDQILGETSPETLVYCCGPEPLIAAVEQTCARLGRPAPRVERFAPKAVDAAELAEDHPFTVVLNSTGQEFVVGTNDTIIEVLQDAGIRVDSSCCEGVCGTCETKVISGEIAHRDSLLSQEERDENVYMMICVSRCKGDRLVLDL